MHSESLPGSKMNKTKIIRDTAKFVREKLEGEGSGHDWWHVYRVWQTAKHIAKTEKADLFIVELAALLHDIADWKLHDGDESIGRRIASEWLAKNQVTKEIINHVGDIVQNISFKGGANKGKLKTIEGLIVQDADRLEALGAIGIARCFTFGGAKSLPIHVPRTRSDKSGYKTHISNTSINHFYDKLLLLKDLMNTKTGKKMAIQRHKYMEKYLEQFYEEWEGRL